MVAYGIGLDLFLIGLNKHETPGYRGLEMLDAIGLRRTLSQI